MDLWQERVHEIDARQRYNGRGESDERIGRKWVKESINLGRGQHFIKHVVVDGH